MIKYRMIVVNQEGLYQCKLDSKMLPPGIIQVGNRVLHSNGRLYDVVFVAVDLEQVEPEMHVEMIENTEVKE